MSSPSIPHPAGDSQGSDDESEGHGSPATRRSTIQPPPPLKFTEKHRLLKLRLGPLHRVQTDLERRLGAASTEVYSTTASATPFDTPISNKRTPHEFCINSSNGWKTALDKFNPLRNGPRPDIGPGSLRRGKDPEGDEITDVIAGCKDDMRAIWEDPVIKEMLGRRKSRVEDTPGL